MCGAALLLLAALPALAGQAPVAERPAFGPGQRTAVVAPAGHAATLDCRVLRLRDQSVSWVRSRDLQILSHAGAVFTADARVSATAAAAADGSSQQSLRIERLRTADAGRYECQINTEPKMSLFFNLTVVEEPVPAVVVEAMGAARVSAAVGGAATLACEARYWPAPRALPLPPLDVRWRKGDQPVDLQSGRDGGGVALDTQRWHARVESRLTLAALTPRDAGLYTCAADGVAATFTLHLHGEEDRAEAMQRDEAAGAHAPRGPAPCAALLAALLPAALLLLRPR